MLYMWLFLPFWIIVLDTKKKQRKSHVRYFSQYIGDPVLACTVNVLHIWISKQKSSSSKRRFHWRILCGIFPVKTTRK